MSERLCIESVSLELGHRPVVRDVSLELRSGEVVALLGRNGVGKTTLLRIAAGAITPDSGEVRLGATPLSQIPRREIARSVAVVSQDTHIPFPFRVAELVVMGRAPHQPLFGFESAADLALARTSMERLGIAELADRSVFELSGGERQLAMIARALTQEPRFLLLDEPTAFLDLRHRMDVMAVVRGFAEEGRGALVVSHDIALAARACDRMILLVDGRVEATGRPEQVLTPENLRRAFGIAVDIVSGPDGLPVPVPRLAEPS